MENNRNVITSQPPALTVSVDDYNQVKVKSFWARALHTCETSRFIIVRAMTYIVKTIVLRRVLRYTYDAFKMSKDICWLPTINTAIRFTRNETLTNIVKLNIAERARLNETDKEVAKNFIKDLISELFTQAIENKAPKKHKLHINLETLDYEIMKNHIGGLTKKEFYSEFIKAFDFNIRYFEHKIPKLNITVNIVVPQDDSLGKSFNSALNNVNADFRNNLAQLSEEANKFFADSNIKSAPCNLKEAELGEEFPNENMPNKTELEEVKSDTEK